MTVAVESNIKRLTSRVRLVYASMRAAERDETNAREVAAVRRLELGKLLAQVRQLWPARGPKAKGWGDFLRRVRIDEDVALDAMKYAGYVEKHVSRPGAGKLPTMREAGVRRDALTTEERDDQAKDEPDRGAWCTPHPIAAAVGPWDLDPFSNPRSHIVSAERCILEDGGDGFGDRDVPGTYRVGDGAIKGATNRTRVWLQPDYGYVLEAVGHYKHTRFCALLRLDPSTEWFDLLHAHSELILIPKGDRIQFDPPPGVEASSNPYPHGLFFANAKDVTAEIRALSYEWRVR